MVNAQEARHLIWLTSEYFGSPDHPRMVCPSLSSDPEFRTPFPGGGSPEGSGHLLASGLRALAQLGLGSKRGVLERERL